MRSWPALLMVCCLPAPLAWSDTAANEVESATRPSAQASPEPEGLTWIRSRLSGIELTRSEVTVAQYRACALAGRCEKPRSNRSSHHCNWGHPDREQHPINCVDWYQAKAFCEWVGGRLPSEQEWFAEASNGGRRRYPWGDAEASCRFAVMPDEELGCGKRSTWPVCSLPAGNSVSGLCDLSGNVWEWTSSSRKGRRVLLGGSWNRGSPVLLSAKARKYLQPSRRYTSIGFRCGRSRS
ncbi:MAG: SUMF1/EgtB/PvdO family nonheme iron enzyme [Deltaproteobacteria bacterium]|nr:SUMF1/EgtB/PvdO family nonheme iron enzyme [Deltaproteobacteria bacterium]